MASLAEVRKYQPLVFLSLAPKTSGDYPAQPTAEKDQTTRPRRSSTVSSTSSEKSLRFLKLGPVHFGEKADDFHHVTPEE